MMPSRTDVTNPVNACFAFFDPSIHCVSACADVAEKSRSVCVVKLSTCFCKSVQSRNVFSKCDSGGGTCAMETEPGGGGVFPISVLNAFCAVTAARVVA